jgi:ribose transport system substrate-binding protein
MKKILVVLLVLCMVMSFVACGADKAEEPAEKAPEKAEEPAKEEPAMEEEAADEMKTLKFASHNAALSGNPYRIRYEADIKEALEDAKNYGFDMSYASFVAEWDPAVEQQLLENSINEGYDILLVNPVSNNGIDPLIDKAIDAGIKMIFADIPYMSERTLNVGADQYEFGYESATFVGETLGSGTKVILINAIEGNIANDWREDGFNAAIEEQGLDVVGKYNHNWDATTAVDVMAQIINSGVEFDAILTSQLAESLLTAYETTGADLPKAIAFGDVAQYGQKMLEVNKDEEVVSYLFMSNPPGVGAIALNFGLNEMMGEEIKPEVITSYEQDGLKFDMVRIPSRLTFTYENQEEYRDQIEAMAPSDAVTYWLTVDEVKSEFFK